MKGLDKRGITLIEVLISLAILGILTLLFMTVMGTAINMRKTVFEQASSSMAIIKDIANEDNGVIAQEKQISIEFQGNKTLYITGTLINKEDNNVGYHLFVPY